MNTESDHCLHVLGYRGRHPNHWMFRLQGMVPDDFFYFNCYTLCIILKCDDLLLFCSNIYKQQKLLSISFDANPGHVQQSMVDSQGMWDQMLVVSRRSTPIGATLPFVGFLAFFVVAGFCIYHMNLVRRKPRRRRAGKGGAPRRTFIAKHPVV